MSTAVELAMILSVIENKRLNVRRKKNKMKIKQAIKLAKEHKAHPELIEWLESLPSDADPWTECKRADWMIWAVVMLGVPKKRWIAALCRCVRDVLPSHAREPEVILTMFDIVKDCICGKATIEQVVAARQDAATAAFANLDHMYGDPFPPHAAAACSIADLMVTMQKEPLRAARVNAVDAVAAIIFAANVVNGSVPTINLKRFSDIIREVIPTPTV
jgi:hypothetical protein